MAKSKTRVPRVARRKTPLHTATLKIGEVAKKVGMPIVSVRFYEIAKLITPVKIPGKTTGHRRFLPSVLGEIEFIQTCRSAELSLPEIKSLMKLVRGFKPPSKPRMQAVLRSIEAIRLRTRKLEEIERILMLRLGDPESDIEKLIAEDSEIMQLRGFQKAERPSTIKVDPHRD